MKTNGHANGTNGSAIPARWKGLQDYMVINRTLEFANNAYSQREMQRRGQGLGEDQRRSIEDECGYPPIDAFISPWDYQRMYERFSIAARVVEVLPRSSWQVQPTIYETEESEVTPFEQAWDDLSKQLGGNGWYQDEQGALLWDYCRRVDEQCGIGTFGLLLIGFNDGKPLGEPVDGVGVVNPRDKDKPGKGTPEGAGQQGKGQPQGPPVQGGVQGEQVNQPNAPQFGKSQRVGKQTSNVLRGPRLIPEMPRLVDNYVDPKTKQPPTPGQLRGEDQFARESQGQSFADGDKDGLSPNEQQGEGRPQQPAGPSAPGQQQLGPDGQPIEQQPPFEAKVGVLFLRVFPESQVQVVQREANIQSPRFGQPVRYLVTLHDPRAGSSGVQMPTTSHYVHWSRVIHVPSDLASSEDSGVPRMRTVYDHLLALKKLYGASAEGYWKMAFTTLSFETHPQLGGDVELDTDGVKDELEELQNSLQKALFTTGLTVKPIAPTVVDPTPFIEAHLQAICIKIPCPKRVFMGSERGELASAQDDSQWNDQLRARQLFTITPRILVPLIDRFIQAGVLPEPQPRQEESAAERYAALKQGAEAAPGAEGAPGEAPPGEEGQPGKPPASGGKSAFGGKPTGPFPQNVSAFEEQGGKFRKVGDEIHAEHPSNRGGGGSNATIRIRDSRKYGNGFEVFTSEYGGPKGTDHIETVLGSRPSLAEAKSLAREVVIEKSVLSSKGDQPRDDQGRFASNAKQRSGKVVLARQYLTSNGRPSPLPTNTWYEWRRVTRLVRNADFDPQNPQPGVKPLVPQETVEQVGVTQTKGGYSIEWPDLDSLGKKDRAAIASQNTATAAAYIAGGVESLIPPHQFLTSQTFLGMDDEEAAAMLEEAEAAASAKQAEADAKAMAMGLEPVMPEGFQKPFDEQADDVKLKAGEALVNPETGQVLKGQAAPGMPGQPGAPFQPGGPAGPGQPPFPDKQPLLKGKSGAPPFPPNQNLLGQVEDALPSDEQVRADNMDEAWSIANKEADRLGLSDVERAQLLMEMMEVSECQTA